MLLKEVILARHTITNLLLALRCGLTGSWGLRLALLLLELSHFLHRGHRLLWRCSLWLLLRCTLLSKCILRLLLLWRGGWLLFHGLAKTRSLLHRLSFTKRLLRCLLSLGTLDL